MTEKNKTAVLLILAIIALCILFFSNGGDISVSDVKWSCNSKNCKVTFTILNKSNASVERTVLIRGHKKTGGKAGGLRPAGQANFLLTLYPHEKMTVRKAVSFGKRPDFIIVTVLSNE